MDVDGYSGVTIRDLAVLVWKVFLNHQLNCDSVGEPYQTQSDSATRLLYNCVIPPNESHLVVHLDIQLGLSNMGLGLPMNWTIDGLPVTSLTPNDSVGQEAGWTVASLTTSPVANVPPGSLIGGYIDYSFGFVAPGRHALSQVSIDVVPSTSARTLVIELTEIPAGHNTPMAVHGYSAEMPGIRPLVTPWIIELTGDVNNDRVINSADIIRTVNFVFKSGAALYPHAASADGNCSGTVTSADVIAMVNFVFKSGAPLCAVQQNCLVTASGWSCP